MSMSGRGPGGARPISAASQRGLRRGARVPAMPGAELRSRVLRAVRADPEVMLYAARVSVWARWLLMLVAVVELAYRPELWFATDKEYLFLSLPLPAFNGFLHYRLRRDRAVTWRWLLFLSAVDIALITAVVIIGGEFHLFSYVAYYPALALFAVVFPYLWLSLAWATMAGAIYAVVSLMVGPGLDFDAGQEKALLARVMAMYGVVASVSLIARFERVRRQESAERERELQRERIELSQTIHDTVAQTAYMISMGIHRAIRQAGGLERGAKRHAGRRLCVEHVKSVQKVSERRACKALLQSRSTHRHEPLDRDDEQAFTDDIVELATRFGRYGNRRITALLKLAGWVVANARVHGTTYRISWEMLDEERAYLG